MIDYFLKSPRANHAGGFRPAAKLVRTFSSDDQHQENIHRFLLPNVGFPSPRFCGTILECTAWCESYLGQLRKPSLTMNRNTANRASKGRTGKLHGEAHRRRKAGHTDSQSCHGPALACNSEVLQRQLELGQQIFGETLEPVARLLKSAQYKNNWLMLSRKLANKSNDQVGSGRSSIGNCENSL